MSADTGIRFDRQIKFLAFRSFDRVEHFLYFFFFEYFFTPIFETSSTFYPLFHIFLFRASNRKEPCSVNMSANQDQSAGKF